MKKNNAFTLIELLIVISLLSILMLAGIMLLNPKKHTSQAKTVNIANDLRNIEKAFRITSIEKGWEKLPTDSEIGEKIKDIIDNGNLKNTTVWKNQYNFGSEYFYDNDDDDYLYLHNCPGEESTEGANIYLKNISDADNNETVLELDKIFDNSDGLNCGKIRTVNNSELWFNMMRK